MPCAPAGVLAGSSAGQGHDALFPSLCCCSRWRRRPPRRRDALAHPGPLRPAADPFIEDYCIRCHNDQDLKGSLDLTDFDYKPGDPANFLTWVKAMRCFVDVV